MQTCGANMYIIKYKKHVLVGNLKTMADAEKEVKYITEECSLYKRNELEIKKEEI
jgi:hypothetical protein